MQNNSLETPIQYIKGVGPRLAQVFAKLGIETVQELFSHYPSYYIDRRNITPISKTTPGKNRVVVGEIVTSGVAFIGKRRSRIFEVIISDSTEAVSAKWFHFQPHMLKRFPKGKKVLLAGELTQYNWQKQMVHPEVEFLEDEKDSEIGGKILPIYPLTEGLTQRLFRKIFKNAWEKYSFAVKPMLPDSLIAEHNLLPHKQAVLEIHQPPNDADLNLLNTCRSPAHRTIIFTEFFLFELMLEAKKRGIQRESGFSFIFKEDIHDKFLQALPFQLTKAQERVIGEIRRDMEIAHPMNRLLLGDVGSGKTVVALACALQATANGRQAAFMAPTEILAEQHYGTISKITDALKIPCALLTANVKGAERKKIYEGVLKGSIPLLIGTHAVIQEDVKFATLGLAVIDEQHRFGVEQREALHKKGRIRPDVLVMTATPIPRTLAMTFYGDLEASLLDELPKGRKETITKIYKARDREKLYGGMKVELERGHQIYVVYPLIEESEKLDLKNATEMCQELKRVFEPKFKVELLHGQMKAVEKDSVMRRFKDGEVSVLAATSVVEVGVDVRNATVMVVEHAERFGLAQLHQLRGRVGRSDIQSFCILVCGGRLGEEASQRLNIMVETTDGFRIAEEDLKIRGPGEFLGTKQSGVAQFKLADLVRDEAILQIARRSALTADERAYEHVKGNRGIELGAIA